MSDHKKLIEDIESGKPIKGPSMGAQVEQSVCTICGETGAHAHKGDVVKYDPDDYSSLQVIAFSFVSAPTCDVCREPMEYLKTGTEWACRDAICTAFNKPISTGIGGVIG